MLALYDEFDTYWQNGDYKKISDIIFAEWHIFIVSILWLRGFDSLYYLKAKGGFTLHNFCLKLLHATCLQLELHCVNQGYQVVHNSYMTT
jgi:hypothetical protein